MPGFTAPKLLWVARHEPAVFSRLSHVLLPKAWIRYRLTGELIEEMSDASGTLWLDVGRGNGRRPFSPRPRCAPMRCRAGRGQRPGACCGPSWRALGHAAGVVLAGGGRQRRRRSRLGAIHPGDAFVSLGTSGVLWATTDRFMPYPQAAVHAFCHALPGLWHQMG